MTHRPPSSCPPFVPHPADEDGDDPTRFVRCSGSRSPQSGAREGASIFAALPVSAPAMAPAPRPPGAAPSASPFRVAAGPAPPSQASIRLPVVLAVGAVLLAVCGVALFAAGLASSSPPSDHPGSALAVGVPARDTGAEQGADTGAEPEDAAVIPFRAGAPVPQPGHRPAATAPPAVGELVVTLPEPRGVRHLTVSCPSGFRQRSAYDTQPLVVSGVPTSEACTAAFQGASPYRFHGVRGGLRLTCRFEEGMTHCQRD